MPEEIPLGEDCKDWNNRITDAERNLLTQVFRFFTQSDVEVQDNYMERYARVFRPTEIKMMLAAFANMETVHIAAYALLLETLGMPDSEFTAFMDYAAMRDKHDYLQGFGVETRCRHAAHAGDVRRIHRRAAAVRELRDPAELPAPQQDARHGAGGLVERARRDPALRRHHPAVPHLRAGNRRADADREGRHRRLRAHRGEARGSLRRSRLRDGSRSKGCRPPRSRPTSATSPTGA